MTIAYARRLRKRDPRHLSFLGVSRVHVSAVEKSSYDFTRLHFNMANRDKGRRKWGGFSQGTLTITLIISRSRTSQRRIIADTLVRPTRDQIRRPPSQDSMCKINLTKQANL